MPDAASRREEARTYRNRSWAVRLAVVDLSITLVFPIAILVFEPSAASGRTMVTIATLAYVCLIGAALRRYLRMHVSRQGGRIAYANALTRAEFGIADVVSYEPYHVYTGRYAVRATVDVDGVLKRHKLRALPFEHVDFLVLDREPD